MATGGARAPASLRARRRARGEGETVPQCASPRCEVPEGVELDEEASERRIGVDPSSDGAPMAAVARVWAREEPAALFHEMRESVALLLGWRTGLGVRAKKGHDARTRAATGLAESSSLTRKMKILTGGAHLSAVEKKKRVGGVELGRGKRMGRRCGCGGAG